MKRIPLYLPVILFLAFVAGCSEQKIEVYSDRDYIYFEASTVDTTSFTFFFHPGETDVEIELPMGLIGKASDKDRPFNVSVDMKRTTAPIETYTLPNTSIFESGKYTSTLKVLLHKTSALNQNVYTLALKVESNDCFEVGPSTNAIHIIKLTAMVSRPQWWTNTIEQDYLGPYSAKKFDLLIQQSGVTDMTGLKDDEIRSAVLSLKYYLLSEKEAGRTVREEDGSEMIVKVLG